MIKLVQIFLAFTMLSSTSLQAQKTSVWKPISLNETSSLTKVILNHSNTDGEKYYTLNTIELKQTLSNVANVRANTNGTIVSIPNLNGELEQFEVWENSNFDPILQAQYPEIRAYTGKGITDKSATINFSLAPIGMQTAVFRAEKDAEFIEAYDKTASVYVAFSSKNSHSNQIAYKCGVDEKNVSFKPDYKKTRSSAGQLKTMRLAASCNGEYAQHFGGTVIGALSGINASMTRMNALFEKDLAIHLNLIATTTNLIYLNPLTDPFSDGAIGAAGAWNTEAQNNLSANIGNGAYDIGHLFCKTGGGGNAGCIGCVCVDDNITDLTDKNKGAGFTAPESSTAAPEGDVFDYDFLAHEFGHQFGASHTFSYSYEGSGTNIEPGSGCATMGYAGVTGPYDVQPHNIIQFATASIVQVQANMATKTCPVSTTSSATPVVNAGANYTIPKGTAFLLTGTGSDADINDILTYSWEQNDDGTMNTEGINCTTTDTKIEGPTFRLYTATTSPIRYMPKLEYVLLGQLTTPSNWESVSNVARDLNFNLTVRDNHLGAGQTKTDTMKVTVVTTSGPFVVTSQNTPSINYTGGTAHTITWNVNNTNVLAGSSTVNILISTDAGLTFPTTLATGVPNNGSASVTMPNITAPNCRIMIQPTANIYYAVNSTPFAISFSAPLSVTIKTFTGETQNETNMLHWTTSQEINLLNYELQHSSNAIDFTTIATIKATATNQEASYNYTDTKPFNGNNYYRLQANDIDGKVNYSEIINLFIKKTEPYIYPNPASDNVTVEMQNTTFSFKIIDINGNVVSNKSSINSKTQIDTHTFANGIYTIEITTNEGNLFTQKINITH